MKYYKYFGLLAAMLKKIRITKTHNIKTTDNRSTCNSAMSTFKWVTHSAEDLGTSMVQD
jgi:hypothetical protein